MELPRRPSGSNAVDFVKAKTTRTQFRFATVLSTVTQPEPASLGSVLPRCGRPVGDAQYVYRVARKARVIDRMSSTLVLTPYRAQRIHIALGAHLNKFLKP